MGLRIADFGGQWSVVRGQTTDRRPLTTNPRSLFLILALTLAAAAPAPPAPVDRGTTTGPSNSLTPQQQELIAQASHLEQQAADYSNRALDTEAVLAAQQAADLRRQALGPDDPGYAYSLNGLGMICSLAGNWDLAEQSYRAAADIEERALGRDASSYRESRWRLAGALGGLADAAAARVDFRAAHDLRGQAIEIITALFGPNDYRAIDARIALALVDQQAALGPEKRRDLRQASDLLSKADELAGENSIHPAIDAAREGLKIYTAILGEDDSNTINAMEKLATLSDRSGDAGGAAELLHKAVELRAKVLGRHHPAYLESRVRELLRLADRAEAAEDFETAQKCRQEGLELLREYHDRFDWQVVNATQALAYDQRVLSLAPEKRAALTRADRQLADADARGREGKYDEAVRIAQQAQETRQEILGKDHLECAGTLGVVASLCAARKDFEQAVKYQRMATDLRLRVLSPEHPETQRSEGDLCQDLEWLASQRQEAGDLPGALKAEEQLLEAQQRLLGPSHWKVVNTRIWIDYIGRVRKMTPAQRQASARSDDLSRQAGELERRGDLKGAIGLLRQAMDLQAQSLGDDTGAFADMVYHLADLCQGCGDMKASAEAFRRAAELRERVFGRAHPSWPDAMDRRVTPLESVISQAWQAKDYATAIRFDQELAAVQADLHGPHDWRVTDAKLDESNARRMAGLSPQQMKELEDTNAIDDQGAALSRQFKWREAADCARAAMDRRRKVLGISQRDIDSLADLATAYDAMGDPRAADDARRESVELRRQFLGEDHPAYLLFEADSSRQQANRALAGDDLASARSLAQRSLQVQYRALRPGAWEIRETQFFLEYVDQVAALSADQRRQLRQLNEREGKLASQAIAGNPAAAIDEYRKIVDERGKLIGADGLSYALSLYTFGSICLDADDYAQAEKLLTRAVDIRAKWLGEQSGPVIEALAQLSEVYASWNDLPRAKQTSERAFYLCSGLLRQTVHGPYAQMMAAQTLDALFQYSLSMMIAQYEDIADPDQRKAAAASAVPIVRILCDTAQQTLAGNPVRIYGLRILGKLYTLTGELPRAQATLEEAVTAAAQILGPDSLECAAVKHNLATVLMYEGQYDRAMAMAKEVAVVIEKSRGADSPPMAATLQLEAQIHQAAGRSDEALSAERQAMQVQQKCLNRIFAFSSEAEMTNYADSAAPSLELLISMVAARHVDHGPDVDDAMTWVLRRKAIVLSTLFRMREAQAAQMRDPAVATQAQELRRLRQQINDMSTRPPKGWSPQQVQEVSSRLRDRADALESEVNRSIAAAATRPTTAPSGAGFERVRRALPEGWALVEMVRLRVANFHATDSVSAWKPAHYYAIVLLADPSAPARMVDLGDAAEIDAMVGKLRNEFRPLDKDDDEAAREAEYCGIAGVLYDRVFAPLVPLLGGAKHLYIAPDGQLNLVPFEALAQPKGPYLVEQGYEFAYLPGGRDLLRPKSPPGEGTLVFADPNFDLGVLKRQEMTKVVLATELPSPDRSPLRGVHPTDVRGLQFTRLAATTREAADLQVALRDSPFGPVRCFSGDRALSGVFKAVRSPRILHIATHGYYKPDKSGPADRFAPRSNPLLRSVLAFAGANVTREDDAPDDGLVTAEEVSLMDLRGTELVVLSACESGVGDVKNAEGVYGLRRAFLNAGARTLITSLIEVPDEATQQLMSDFYTSLRDSKGKLESLHSAELRLIRERRKAGHAAHPFYWAGFILIGDA